MKVWPLNILRELHPAVVTVMLLSLYFWSYLGMTSQPLIVLDSIGYQNLGKMIVAGPWQNYFISGPSREPLYPLLIAVSMWIAHWQNSDFLIVQVMFQVVLLFVTQILIACLLKRLHVRDECSILALAFFGFSPAVLNSGFILFSEILAYPFVLLLVFQAARAWTELPNVSIGRTITNAFLMALAGLLITFTKGIFEVVVPILLVPYLFLFLKANRKIRIRVCVFITIFFIAFQVPLVAYKLLNKTFNGIYTLTDRGPIAFYGNTARRMQPLDTLRLKTALAYTVGEDICVHFYGKSCDVWGFLPSDILGSQKNTALIQSGLNQQQVYDEEFKAGVVSIFRNPFQYIFLAALEGAKLFFWEGQKMFCVVYPDRVSGIYDNTAFRYILRFLLAAVSCFGLVDGIRRIISNRDNIFNRPDKKAALELYLVLMITAYLTLSSCFFMTARYALPIIPLFLALGTNSLCSRWKNKNYS